VVVVVGVGVFCSGGMDIFWNYMVMESALVCSSCN